jgi:hypothetical protein
MVSVEVSHPDKSTSRNPKPPFTVKDFNTVFSGSLITA